MKTKTIAILAAAAGLVSAANITAQELSWEVNYGIESEYVFRGLEIASESFQGSIEGSYGDSYFGVWMHEAIDSFGSDTSEFDFYAGHGFAIDDTFSLDFGGTLYHYPDASDETFEVFVGIAADTQLAPSLYAFYDVDLEVFTLEGAIGHSISLGDDSSVELGAAVGHVFSDDSIDYLYYSATADYVYALSDNSDFSIGLRYSNNDEDLGLTAGGNLWGGLSITTSF